MNIKIEIDGIKAELSSTLDIERFAMLDAIKELKASVKELWLEKQKKIDKSFGSWNQPSGLSIPDSPPLRERVNGT